MQPKIGRREGLKGGVLHVIEVGNLPLLVGNDGELDVAARDLGNVLDPAVVAVDGVGREADHLDAALGELGLELGEGAELGGAHGGVVLGVGEEDDPAVVDELVEVDGAVRGVGLEVGGRGAEAEAGNLLDIGFAGEDFRRSVARSRGRDNVDRRGIKGVDSRSSAFFSHCDDGELSAGCSCWAVEKAEGRTGR